jgi:hypothetical protein
LLDVTTLKRTQLAAGIAAVKAAPLAAALTARVHHSTAGCTCRFFFHSDASSLRACQAYFAALGLKRRAKNAARFEYAPLRTLFAGAYAKLAGAAYEGGLDFAEEGAAGGPEPVRKRKRAPAAAASPAAPAEEVKEAEAAKAAAPKRRRSASAAAASAPAQQRTLRPRTAR